MNAIVPHVLIMERVSTGSIDIGVFVKKDLKERTVKLTLMNVPATHAKMEELAPTLLTSITVHVSLVTKG